MITTGMKPISMCCCRSTPLHISYKNKQYHVLINGQTGRVQGEYPKSVAKILLMIAGILILIGLFFMATDAFACGAKGVPVAETAQEEYIEYEPLTVDIDGIQEV